MSDASPEPPAGRGRSCRSATTATSYFESPSRLPPHGKTFTERAVRKYLHVLNIGIQNQLVYRANFLFRACFGLLPLIATISLWRTVYSGQEGNVGSYTLAQMISYYLVVTIVDMLTAVS